MRPWESFKWALDWASRIQFVLKVLGSLGLASVLRAVIIKRVPAEWLWPIWLFSACVFLALIEYFPWRQLWRRKQSKIPAVINQAPISTSDLLTNQAHEIAKMRLEELTETAQFLRRQAPKQGANERTFCIFWAESVNKWRSEVIALLQARWGVNTVTDFTDADGFNPHEPIGDVLDGAANGYRELLHCQRNLKNIKRTL